MTDLPSLDEPYNLASDAAGGYRRDGFAVLRGLASPDEVACFRPAIVAAVRRLNRERHPLAERDTYGRAFLQTANLWKHDAAIRRLVMAKRFAAGTRVLEPDNPGRQFDLHVWLPGLVPGDLAATPDNPLLCGEDG